ncbi:MAG: sterol desaturase family protein [Actinomycetota bacterium]
MRTQSTTGKPGRRLAAAGIALAAVVVALAVTGPGLLVALAFAFLTLGGLERLFRRHRYKTFRTGIGTDVTYFLTGNLLALGVLVPVLVVVGLVTFAGLALPLAVFGIGVGGVLGGQPLLLQVLVVLLLFELVGYWVHRLFHEVPFLWRFHAVHHSARQLDWIAGTRIHPGEIAISALMFGPVLLVAFGVTVGGGLFVLFTVVQNIAGAIAHANIRWRLRPLHRLVLTPEYHHWHHSREPDALYKNYAGFLPLMDMIFGTYYMPKNRRPQEYGTDDPVPPTGYLAQLAYPFRRRARTPENPTDALAPLG